MTESEVTEESLRTGKLKTTAGQLRSAFATGACQCSEGCGLLSKRMPQQMPTQTAEDYLERIHELIEEKGYARVVDIASSLEVKQASVTSMVQKLGELGYLNYEKYRGLVLTEKGKTVATGIQKRHETLARFFSLFGLDAETQQRDIEGSSTI
jgi:hypothetical protein